MFFPVKNVTLPLAVAEERPGKWQAQCAVDVFRTETQRGKPSTAMLATHNFATTGGLDRGPAASIASRDNAFYSELDNNAISKLELIGRRRIIRAKDVLFHEGDPVHQYFSVANGIIKLVKTLACGNQRIIALLHPPSFVGLSLCDHHAYAAEAVTDVELCSYQRGSFDLAMKENFGLTRAIFRIKLRELDSSRNLKFLLSRKCAYFRVAGFLLMIATCTSNRGAERTCTGLQLPLTRAEIADYLGLTLETVSRQFSRLKTARIIDLPLGRMVVVRDLALLRGVANGAQANWDGE